MSATNPSGAEYPVVWTLDGSSPVVTASGTTLVAGWWKFDSLNAGRYLWTSGSVTGLRIATTTTELAYTLDRSTTDRLVSTTDAGLTTGTWYYIAVAIHARGSGTNPSDRMYLGTNVTPPRSLPLTDTTLGSGAEVASTSFRVLTDTSGTTQGIRGRAAQVLIVTTTGDTTGSLGTGDPIRLYETFILPHWSGTLNISAALSNLDNTASSTTSDTIVRWIPLDSATDVLGDARFFAYQTTRNYNTGTVTYVSTGASNFSEEEPDGGRNWMLTTQPRLNPVFARR